MSGEAPGSRASPHTDESPVNQRPGGRGPRRRLPHDDRGPPGWPGSRLFIWGFGQPPPPPQPPAKVLKSTVSLDQIQLLAFFFFFFFKNKLCSTDFRHSVGENWTEPSGRPGALWHLRRGQAQPGAFPHGGARDSAVPAGGRAACWPRAVPAATEQTGNRGPDAPQGPWDCRVVASRTAPGPSLTTVTERLTVAGLARCTACPTARVGPSAHGEQGRP